MKCNSLNSANQQTTGVKAESVGTANNMKAVQYIFNTSVSRICEGFEVVLFFFITG